MSKKPYFLSVRISKAEREHLNELSRKSGLSLSNTIRACISGAQLRERQSAEVGALYVEINHIGTNINQIARKMNAGFGSKEDAAEVRLLLGKVCELMERIADR